MTPLTLKTFTVRVLVVPPTVEIRLGISKIHEEVKTISGYTLKDAKERAGIA